MADWDLNLQQLLFAYRTKPQDSTGESPFFLLYGRDAKLPTETALSKTLIPHQEDLDDCRASLVAGLSEAWDAARQSVRKSQKRQKRQYDRKAMPSRYKVGDIVMVFMPHEVPSKQRKMTLPHHGPYRVIELTPKCATLRPVDCVHAKSILIQD